MGLVPIIPSHGRDVIIGLAWINFEFRDLFGRADSCRLPHKAWIERRLRPQLPPAGAVSLASGANEGSPARWRLTEN